MGSVSKISHSCPAIWLLKNSTTSKRFRETSIHYKIAKSVILTEKAKLFAVKPLLDVSLSHVQQSEEDKKVVRSIYRLHPLTAYRAS